mmetsp:Transcript_12341/g.33947  ORF Transcript_12341/g.33947 Transcript_12341/m.33947 type:complete len:465 (-) Transcript_12341:195-1589(-)|eukprot:CAMPEP_0198110248 /NCGR_PEP_ID=MMETSP1442-20131203/2265_1 /TAXON_ID= /ORGANISM="Craspedostauros australis, Strain CCMP3328" /LENGTH=464 /DNA_ID=CAMNT_0043766215 /DNA_START=58 /DNA_END=1452 /DNA_ORIENTATION=+
MRHSALTLVFTVLVVHHGAKPRIVDANDADGISRVDTIVPVNADDGFDRADTSAPHRGSSNHSNNAAREAQTEQDSAMHGDEKRGFNPQQLKEWRQWFEEWKTQPICEIEGCDSFGCFSHPSCPEICEDEDDEEDEYELTQNELYSDHLLMCSEKPPQDECSACTPFVCRIQECQSNGCCDALADEYDAECLGAWNEIFCEKQQPKCWGSSPIECMACGVIECVEPISHRDSICGNCEVCDVLAKFEFVQDLDAFMQRPTEWEMQEIVRYLEDVDLEAPLIEAKDVLSEEQRQMAIDLIEEDFANQEFVTDSSRKQHKYYLSGQDLIDMYGADEVMRLLTLLSTFTGDIDLAVPRAFIQRFDHDGDMVSPYHTDSEAVSLVILLNDDYEGGDMTFLRSDGPYVAERKAGYATIHGEEMAHGNAAVKGIKYQLTLVTYMFTEQDKNDYEYAGKELDCIFDGTELE